MVYKPAMNLLTCDQDQTSVASATVLGFCVEPHPPVNYALPEPDDVVQSLAPAEREEFLSELVKQNALYTTYLMQKQLSEEGLDVSTPRNQRLSIMDQMAKLAKLDKKTSTEQAGGGVSITINIPTLDDQPSKSITIEQVSDEPAETVIYADTHDND